MKRSGPGPGTSSPLWAVQSVTFLGSLGTGAVTNGIYFIAVECGFTPGMNFGLGLLLGLTYIVGAVGVGPALRRLAARSDAVSTRGAMLGLSVVMGVSALIPQIVAWREGGLSGAGWSIWLVVAVYAPASGAYWPLVESYLSGGRSGVRLRRAIGVFNIVWASAVLVAFWVMGPLLAHRPLAILVAFGALQIASIAVVWALGAEPGAHYPEYHEPHPRVYVPLLTTFRFLLPTAYYIVSVWSPYVPDVLERLGVAGAWQAPLAATWMLTRLGAFIVMERWHGWHGRWGAVVVGVVGLVGGVVLALVSPSLPAEAGIPAILVGLAVLGAGIGIIYAAALYYAMEVGKGEIEAGGTHEALIGVGFAGGPLTGLGATALVSGGLVAASHLDFVILAMLGIVLTVVGVVVGLRVWSAARAVGLVGAGSEIPGV